MEFKVTDLALAAFLVASGKKITRNIRDGKRVTFIFDIDKNIEFLASDFYMDAKIPAKTFWNSIKNLKSMCYVDSYSIG